MSKNIIFTIFVAVLSLLLLIHEDAAEDR